MYKAIIIEDEKIAANNLVRMINEINSSFEIIAKLESVNEAVKLLPNLNFDIVFMDIHLSDGDAFEILEKIEFSKPIIFTTAYDQYILKAFKHLSIDYLLKPIDKEELENSISKFEKHFTSKKNNDIDLTALSNLIKKDDLYKERFLIQIGKKLKPILTDQIQYFNSSSKITFLTTTENNSFPIDFSLSNLEQELNPNAFFRINRQYIISRESISHILMVSPTKMKVILKESNDLELYTSIDRMSKFKKWMK